MNSHATANWIRTGLLTLPVYGLLTAWASLDPQPDQAAEPAAWAQFVSSSSYLVSHLIGSTGGTILAIFGTFALGAYLAGGRTARLGLSAMVITVAGHALLLVPAVISTFATPALGQAYLSGIPGAMEVEFPDAMTMTFMLGLLLALIGNLLLGVAAWRSGTLPRWAGTTWIASTLIFYVGGVVLGMATTGSSLPTQSIGALLIAISGGWIAMSAYRREPATLPAVQSETTV